MSKISCLHLSDIHIGKSNSKSVDDFYSTICRDLKAHNQKINIVICTGDLFLGKTKDKSVLINRTVDFFNNLMNRINKEMLFCDCPLIKNDFIFVPGNHDVDRSSSNQYHDYEDFLNKFYTSKLKKKIYNNDYYFITKIFEEEKIAFVGLNSCMVKKTITNQENEWINGLEFNTISLGDKETEIKDFLIKSKTDFDDYGEISTKQLLDAFDQLKESIDVNSYKIVAFFHHHIYPFPEIYDKYGDSSMIRNFSNVINSLMDNNVKIILHGHKHMPISRLITTNKYFENPEKSMYVFSTGTLENIDGQRAFEVVDVHSPNQIIEAEIFKYNYSGEELQKRDEICIPPKYNTKDGSIGQFKDKLRQKDLKLYEEYKNEIEERDNVSTKYGVINLISNLESTFLNFDGINQDLIREPEMIFKLLSFVHYRIVELDSINSGTNNILVLELIKKSLKKIIKDPEYLDELLYILMSDKSSEFNTRIKSVFDNMKYNNQRKTTAYLSVVTLFTDLFLSISPYGEVYFKKEGLEHKINIKIGDGEFNTNIPNNSIKIMGEEDRRCAIISFKCKNPTAHKIGVLIVKDFEERITKIEEAFKELNLKLYYIRPKVEKDGYELDNYNFEAYIPTLLPLLTGDNLYSQKEVFIRELIQNSYDAIRLREKLDDSNFDKNIYIEIGSEKRENGRMIRFLKIKDFGVGMDLYKIERYFTSIGRSFYTSDDFEELQRDKNIQYKAVSNFGIGFLSVFMVCKEVKVKTKALFSKEGIDIHIPNYEGCFFINKNNKISTTGTEIIIYQDERGLINTSNILKFIRENFLDIGLNINVKYPNKVHFFEADKLKKDLPKFSLFVPFDENEVKQINVENVIDKSFIGKYPFGCAVNFKIQDKDRDRTLLLNSGIKVNSKSNQFEMPIDSNYLAKVSYNFPSSNINLDVSRDKILNLKVNDINLFKESIKQKVAKQTFELIEQIKCNYKKESLLFVNQLVEFGLTLDKEIDFISNSYSLLIKKDGNDFKFIACNPKQLDAYKKDKDIICGTNISGSFLFSDRFVKYLEEYWNLSKNNKKHLENINKNVFEDSFLFKERFYHQSIEPLNENIQENLNLIFKKILENYSNQFNKKIIYKSFFDTKAEAVSMNLFNDEIINDKRTKYEINKRFSEIENFNIDVLTTMFPIYKLFLSSYTIEEIEYM